MCRGKFWFIVFKNRKTGDLACGFCRGPDNADDLMHEVITELLPRNIITIDDSVIEDMFPQTDAAENPFPPEETLFEEVRQVTINSPEDFERIAYDAYERYNLGEQE